LAEADRSTQLSYADALTESSIRRRERRYADASEQITLPVAPPGALLDG